MTCHQACKPVVLVDGRSVCNYSEEYRAQCEAAWILNMPLDRRRRMLDLIGQKRGLDAMRKLEDEVRHLHSARKLALA